MTNEPNILTKDEVTALRKCGKCGGGLLPVFVTGKQRSFAGADGILKLQWECSLGHKVWLADTAESPDSVAL